jgi:hypothetical protein
MKNTIRLAIGLISSIVVVSSAVASAQTDTSISATSQVGYDSNPYRLNDQFLIEDSSFFSYAIKAKHELNKKIRIKAKLDQQIYTGAATQGDNQTVTAELRYQTGKKTRPTGVEVGFKQFDKTYVSRLQGSTATYSGVSLDNRYNFQQVDVTAYTTFKVKKRMYNKITAYLTSKNYTDYDLPAITDYDYNSMKLKNSFMHKIRKGESHNFDATYEMRVFSNRDKKDINGDKILNTQMIFNYYSVAYEYNYKPRAKIDLGLALSYKIRRDNASGYYDSAWLGLSLNAKYTLSKNTKIEMAYQYTDFKFDRQPELDITGKDDEFASDSHHKYQVSSKTRLPKWIGSRSYWEAEYSYTTAESNYANYTFDRHQLKTGLRIVF